MTTSVSSGRWSVPVPGGNRPVVVALDRADGHGNGDSGPSPDEASSAAGLASHRREEFVRGRRLLRTTVAWTTGADPADVVVHGLPGTRPELDDATAGVSVSHTARHTAAAIWPDGAVGVDVSDSGTVGDSLVRRCCHRKLDEVLALGAPARAAAFARVWSVQEACVKARGLGLSAAPWRSPVDPWATDGWWEDVRWHVVHADGRRSLAVAVLPVDRPTNNEQESNRADP